MLPPNLRRLLTGIYSRLELEDIFPHSIRRILLDLSAGIALVLFGMLMFGFYNDLHIRGGFIVALAVTLWIGSLEAYFYSGFTSAAREEFRVSFEIARVIFYADDEDLVHGLLFSETGDETMKRLGFTEKDIKDYLVSRQVVSFEKFMATIDGHLSVEKYAEILYKNDKSLSDLLFTKGLGLSEFIAAFRWTISKDFRTTDSERFWSRDKLGRIPGIGKNWSYGQTYILERYGEDLTDSATIYDESYERVHQKVVERLESLLVRGHGSNAVVVSDDESSRTDVITMLAGWIARGKAMPGIDHKRVFLLNPKLIIEGALDKISFERDFTEILTQVARAKNVILVIPNLSSFVDSSKTLGVDLVSVLAPYISSSALHIVALDSKANFYDKLSNNEVFLKYFEILDAGVGSDEGVVSMLEAEAEKIEKHTSVLFTYPALLAIADSSRGYFDLATVAEKAKGLLIAAPREAAHEGRRVVLKEDIQRLVTDRANK